MKVVRVADKVFIGKDIIHVAIFQKSDERTTYNMIYMDGKTGVNYAKRFNVTGVTREKEYDLTKGSEKSKVHYFSANPNGSITPILWTIAYPMDYCAVPAAALQTFNLHLTTSNSVQSFL